ncbi:MULTISPECIES: arginase family protein [unclassified Streptomyces]|uniref:arginase family protein n=1 Tax=unclassified Streptomyces TaxID=2593676 RepID=UPI00081DEFBE|nr:MULTISPECIES: arginase family protein [unclassified Streptomyces]MYR28293.1 arginase family protein [Streptomyces sp. SID4945]SCE02799.1 arginase [Streptomyces sp. TverLS-915]SCF36278.1 arginase [Streptomyces sp. LcepLS]
MRRTVIIDAPSNLGLRPPAPGEVPGCHGLAAALRARDLPRRIGAHDGGAVPAPAYDRGDWRLGDGVFHAPQLATYTRRLAERIGTLLDAGDFPVVLGGDCAIQLGASLALRRRGRYGLLAADASADFRHLGNAPAVGAAAGEEVAIATGRGQADLADIDGLRPYLREEDIRYAGIRDGDEDIPELTSLGMDVVTVAALRERGPGAVGAALAEELGSGGRAGYWVHCDADVLDPAVMPAVDSPDPGGLEPDELTELLRPLLAHPGCVGLNVTIYDPDKDPEGTAGDTLADLLAAAFPQG